MIAPKPGEVWSVFSRFADVLQARRVCLIISVLPMRGLLHRSWNCRLLLACCGTVISELVDAEDRRLM